ncbi:hypothetical protein WSS_A28789 [Rhodococcus opacus M213]|uniref:DUF3533 domain-containing protein n=1 Tax=Rhodococcus opacus M213 TaxID=1129896 RepID=K8XE77_RHOOP|nr:DUF3533 domain-containing protein [Rhodococcus opacus]EKT79151.1 hypothetical protein WSS_A28789 [Rhodococcus opacus M213]UOT02945.1 SNG1 family protein [Rhodococcus opacus]
MAHETSGAGRMSVLRTPRFWIAPLLLVSVVMSLLAALYMGGMLNPTTHLNHFPIALVNQDEGDTTPNSNPPQQQNFGDQITAGLVEGVDPDKVELRQIGIAQAQSALDNGEIYGAIVIPSDFTKRTFILAQASVIPGDVERPVITIYTNPRAGTISANLVQNIGEMALDKANQTMGEQLTTQVTQQLQATAPDLQLSGASRLVLDDPIDVRVVAHNPLPDGTGFGLAAFYYALLIVLAGFTGATIASTLIDGMLGFTPTEVGPLYLHNEAVPISRFNTLLIKWAVMVVLAMIVSGLYLWISSALGLPITDPLALWEYGAFAIAAVGITAMSVMAAFGNLGLLINLLVFVVLALPSSGGTIPLEAAPRLYTWLGEFEPMHQIYIGVRAIMFFGAAGDAGLIHAVWMTLAGLLIGLVFGAVITRFYDRKGLHRRHKAQTEPEPVDATGA